MATIVQYTSGQAAQGVKLAVDAIRSTNGSFPSTPWGQSVVERVKQSKPLHVSEEQASDFIKRAKYCAVGERVCKCVYNNAPYSESVFLDDLAQAMVEAGKAIAVESQVAISVLERYPRFPIIVARVSGRYMEICRSWPRTCIYWNMEQYNIDCIYRIQKDSKR